jgi:serine/threonine protein kinase
MSLSPGTKLGPYEIQAPLGAGGMGEVYRARDTRLDRIVAIKVLLSRLSSDPDLKQRLGREARAISSLNHPHICALYDIGTQEDIDFLVMEYLEGQTLADRLQKGALPIDQVLKAGIEIADALAKAHRQGIIHRDLKTGNIMLTKSGAKLMDFGLAKPVRAAFLAGTSVGTPTLSNRLTTEGTIVGTLQYMAPEQLEGKEADVRSDIFAFGAVLYEMVTGKSAFGGKTPASIVAAILASAPTPVAATLQPTSPIELNRLIATA